MPQQYQGTIVDHTILSPSYHWVTINLDNPHELEFKSGQFILLSLPNSPVKKAYSIPSSPANKSQINLLVDISPHGRGTSYIASFKPGDTCTFVAPAGQFYLMDNPEEEKLCFIATGSGLSAVRSMILWLLQTQHDQRQMSLHWGMRHVEDTFWVEDFRMLEKEFPNFHFDLVLSQPPEGWPLCKGHVNDCIAAHYDSLEKTGFYICGSVRMVTDMTALLESKHVKPECIHHERFG
jgi:Na+-transporting NADH:ubiquinone oxidoreductase subunit F